MKRCEKALMNKNSVPGIFEELEISCRYLMRVNFERPLP
jgi:hypothetical protein